MTFYKASPVAPLSDPFCPLSPPNGLIRDLGLLLSRASPDSSDESLLSRVLSDAASLIATNPDGYCMTAHRLNLIPTLIRLFSLQSPSVISACFSIINAFASGGRISLALLKEGPLIDRLCELSSQIPVYLPLVLKTLQTVFRSCANAGIPHQISDSQLDGIIGAGRAGFNPELIAFFADLCVDVVTLTNPSSEGKNGIATAICLLLGTASPGCGHGGLKSLFNCLAVLLAKRDEDVIEFLTEWTPFRTISKTFGRWGDLDLIALFDCLVQFCEIVDRPPFLAEFELTQVLAFGRSTNPEVAVRALTFFAVLVEEGFVERGLIESEGINAALFGMLQSESFGAKVMALRYFHAFGCRFGWGELPVDAHLRFIETSLDFTGLQAIRETRWCLAGILAALASPNPQIAARTICLLQELNGRDILDELCFSPDDLIAPTAAKILRLLPPT
jgi:hypothetical protein